VLLLARPAVSATVPTAPVEFDRSRLTWVERGLRAFTDVRPGEGRIALVMFANVFLILCAYYFIKPLREGWIAVSGLGGLSKLELRAYTAFGQSLLLIPIVAGYGRLVGLWPRAVLVERATLFTMSNMVIFWALQPQLFIEHVPVVGVLFYLWVGMFSVFVVAQFWAFAADLYSEERGNRLLPLIAIGATAGAAVGSLLLEKLVSSGTLPSQHVLLIALVPLAASIWLTRTADAAEGATHAHTVVAGGSTRAERRGALRLVFGNRFLLAVGLIMLLTNWVKTNGENQLFDVLQRAVQGDVAAQALTGDAAKEYVKASTTAFFGGFYWWVNAIALVLQAIVASRVLKYGGFAALFLLLPVVSLLSFSVMLVVPLLAVVRTAQAGVNATDYSINNTARHVLWLPMSQEVTFKGKPTIDSLFVRAGDGMAAVTVLLGVQLLSASIRTYMTLNVALTVLWLVAALWVVREHGRMRDRMDDAQQDEGGTVHALSGDGELARTKV
jgi:AAA family ATP:ADP antiporter